MAGRGLAVSPRLGERAVFYGRDRQQHRAVFVDAWGKHREGRALEPLERLVVEVLREHPEYHALVMSPGVLEAEFTPQGGPANPFLHMGMHIAIREQVATDRPAGITGLYRALRPVFAHAHELEHGLMECLGEALWTAQRRAATPDEGRYLECVRKLAAGRGVPIA